MLRVEYTPQAMEDLQRLREYVSSNWGYKQFVKIYLNLLKSVYE